MGACRFRPDLDLIVHPLGRNRTQAQAPASTPHQPRLLGSAAIFMSDRRAASAVCLLLVRALCFRVNGVLFGRCTMFFIMSGAAWDIGHCPEVPCPCLLLLRSNACPLPRLCSKVPPRSPCDAAAGRVDSCCQSSLIW